MAKEKIKKDSRIEAISALVKAGNVSSFKDIFDIIPVSTVATLSKMHYSTLHKKVNNPRLLKIEECMLLATLFSLSVNDIVTLSMNDINRKTKN
jgi:hypothetical protein